MPGLILEGGSLRGIFTAGVLDAFLDNNLEFPYIIGVSAGITNGVSYISKQKGRNLEVLQKYRNDKRYLSLRNYFKEKSFFGANFLFDDIPNKLVPFDRENYMNFKGTIKIGLTNATTGKIEYKDGKTINETSDLLRASCSIPFVFPPALVGSTLYFDGGLADSIPIRKSLEDGNKKNLIILTQPLGFQKKLTTGYKIVSKLYKHKYPEISKLLLDRYNQYNETIKFIHQQEKENPENLLVIRPEYQLSSFEKEVPVLEKTYNHGYALGLKYIDKIRALF